MSFKDILEVKMQDMFQMYNRNWKVSNLKFLKIKG